MTDDKKNSLAAQIEKNFVFKVSEVQQTWGGLEYVAVSFNFHSFLSCHRPAIGLDYLERAKAEIKLAVITAVINSEWVKE